MTHLLFVAVSILVSVLMIIQQPHFVDLAPGSSAPLLQQFAWDSSCPWDRTTSSSSSQTCTGCSYLQGPSQVPVGECGMSCAATWMRFPLTSNRTAVSGQVAVIGGVATPAQLAAVKVGIHETSGSRKRGFVSNVVLSYKGEPQLAWAGYDPTPCGQVFEVTNFGVVSSQGLAQPRYFDTIEVTVEQPWSPELQQFLDVSITSLTLESYQGEATPSSTCMVLYTAAFLLLEVLSVVYRRVACESCRRSLKRQRAVPAAVLKEDKRWAIVEGGVALYLAILGAIIGFSSLPSAITRAQLLRYMSMNSQAPFLYIGLYSTVLIICLAALHFAFKRRRRQLLPHGSLAVASFAMRVGDPRWHKLVGVLVVAEWLAITFLAFTSAATVVISQQAPPVWLHVAFTALVVVWVVVRGDVALAYWCTPASVVAEHMLPTTALIGVDGSSSVSGRMVARIRKMVRARRARRRSRARGGMNDELRMCVRFMDVSEGGEEASEAGVDLVARDVTSTFGIPASSSSSSARRGGEREIELINPSPRHKQAISISAALHLLGRRDGSDLRLGKPLQQELRAGIMGSGLTVPLSLSASSSSGSGAGVGYGYGACVGQDYVRLSEVEVSEADNDSVARRTAAGLPPPHPVTWSRASMAVQGCSPGPLIPLRHAMVPVKLSSREGKRVAELFAASLDVTGVKLVRVERVQNTWLWRRWRQRVRELRCEVQRAREYAVAHPELLAPSARRRVAEGELSVVVQGRGRGGGSELIASLPAGHQELLMWHGSDCGAIADICETGFSLSAAKRGMIGRGVYFAPSSGSSLGYAHERQRQSRVDADAAGVPAPNTTAIIEQVVLAQVAVGVTVEVDRQAPASQLMLPSYSSHPSECLMWDAAVDKQSGSALPHMLCVFDQRQAYPAYVLTVQR